MSGPALQGWVWASIAMLPTDAPTDTRAREPLGTLSRRRFTVRCQYENGVDQRRSGPGGGVPDVTYNLTLRTADCRTNSWTPRVGDLCEGITDRFGGVIEARHCYLVNTGRAVVGAARAVLATYGFHTDMPARRDD